MSQRERQIDFKRLKAWSEYKGLDEDNQLFRDDIKYLLSHLDERQATIERLKEDFRVMREIAMDSLLQQYLPDEVDQEFSKRRKI